MCGGGEGIIVCECMCVSECECVCLSLCECMGGGT